MKKVSIGKKKKIKKAYQLLKIVNGYTLSLRAAAIETCTIRLTPSDLHT